MILPVPFVRSEYLTVTSVPSGFLHVPLLPRKSVYVKIFSGHVIALGAATPLRL